MAKKSGRSRYFKFASGSNRAQRSTVARFARIARRGGSLPLTATASKVSKVVAGHRKLMSGLGAVSFAKTRHMGIPRGPAYRSSRKAAARYLRQARSGTLSGAYSHLRGKAASVVGAHRSRTRTARQRAQSRVNGAKNRGRRGGR